MSMTKALAAVIQMHYLKEYDEHSWECGCTIKAIGTKTGWANHVAEAIDDENIVMERP